MADPIPYTPGFDYSAFEASNPTVPKPGAQLDNDFENIGQSIDSLVDSVTDIRRSDGQLQNGSVGVDALSTGISPGFVLRGQWASGVQYIAADSVVYDDVFYRTVVAHTSAPADRPDLAPSIWVALFSVGSLSGAMSAFTYDPQNIQADAFARANHTGTQTVDTVFGLQATLASLNAGVAAAMPLAGGIFTGDVSHNGFEITNALAIADTFVFADPATPTKKARFDVSGVTAGQTRTIVMPDRNVDLGKIGMELVSSIDLTGAASTAGAFTGLSGTDADQYELHIINAIPATSGSDIYLENSVNGGSSYGASATVNWCRNQQAMNSGAPTYPQATLDTKIILANNISNTAGVNGLKATVVLFPAVAGTWGAMFSLLAHTGAVDYAGAGGGDFPANTNAIRVRPSTGGWSTGRLNLYRLRH